MYCRKCGHEMSDDNRFCAQCGTPVNIKEKQPMLPPKRRKAKKLWIVAVAIIAVAIVAILFLNPFNERITGKWVVVDDSSNWSYPDVLILSEDGTGFTDGDSSTWRTEDGQLTLTLDTFLGRFTFIYYYSIDGDTLILRELDDDIQKEVAYTRVE